MPSTLVREEDRFRREPTTTKGHYVRQAVEHQRIYSKKDLRPEDENNIRTMRSQMHFETTYRDLFLGKTPPVKLPNLGNFFFNHEVFCVMDSEKTVGWIFI